MYYMMNLKQTTSAMETKRHVLTLHHAFFSFGPEKCYLLIPTPIAFDWDPSPHPLAWF
jgi:hypothetical protein